jgi:proteasome lid subunit RPN8/RPN11
MGMSRHKKNGPSREEAAWNEPQFGAALDTSGEAKPSGDDAKPSGSDAKPSSSLFIKPAGPDAATLRPGEFPLRILPKTAGRRESRYQVIFRQSALDEIHRHGQSSLDAEVCGVLVGDVYQDRTAPWAYVEHAIRGNGAVGKQTQVTITSETWTRIHETLERDYPGKIILGWYHTHPGFGIFLSGMDLFIQDNFFNTPWQVAFVYDPVGGDEGVFTWRGGKSERDEFLIEHDTAGASPDGKLPQAVADLASRLRTVERRLKAVFTVVLFIILAAIVLPMLLFVFGVPSWLPLPGPRHATQPAAKPAPESDKFRASTALPAGAPSLDRPRVTTMGRPATRPADFGGPETWPAKSAAH